MQQPQPIELTFQVTYPGRWDGELGVLTRTTLRLSDQNGCLAAWRRKIREARDRAHTASANAMKASGKKRQFWFFIERQRLAQKQRHVGRTRRALLKMLRRGAEALDLEVAYNSSSPEAFHSEIDPGTLQELREELERAEDLWIHEPSDLKMAA